MIMKRQEANRIVAALMTAILMGITLLGNVADAASSIKLNKKTAKVKVGKSFKLKVLGTKKKVKWKSSNKKIATVSTKGKVVAKKAGNTVVTAKVNGKTLRCKVTVTKKTTSQTAKTSTTLAQQKKVISIVNQHRKKEGLPELTMDDKLMKAAQDRANELTKEFSHTRPNGTSCFTIFTKYDITAGCSGENIAAGQRDAQSVMDAWMHSEGHKKNIMNKNFNKIGVGLVMNSKDEYSYYWVQLFTD